MMDASIGVNLRVTAHSNQGGRKYMEDMFCVAYQPTADEKDLLYAYFGIFDGHGGREAALYAKTHLMDHIVSQKNFWSEEDELVLKSIKDGFISVHQAMWRELDKWPKTQSGLPSTSGTTASVAFVRRGKLYVGHVGDSGIVLGYQDPNSNFWKAKPLTMDHKPESPVENARIQECGGKVVSKSGVPRVVWNRPRLGHKGPVRRSTLIDEIPFLAVARSLGDLWSYNSEQDEFVVSPVPDTAVIEIDVTAHRCLILGSDGLWNMLSSQDAVNSVYFAEKNNERQNQLAAQLSDGVVSQKNWINPSKRLVDRALDRWFSHNLRADNTSVVTVVIDPPGPPRVQKTPSPRQMAASSLKTDRLGCAQTRLTCAHTTNHGVASSSRVPRAIATTRFAEPSPPRVTSPPQVRPPLKSQPESPSVHPGKSLAGKSTTTTAGFAKVKGTVAATTTSLSRARDLPARGTRAHPSLSSKTSRVAHVRTTHSISSLACSSQKMSASTTLLSSSAHEDKKREEAKPSDDQVQINEISSSCEESCRSEASHLDDSVQASSIERAQIRKQGRRGAKGSQPQPTVAAAKNRKRKSRQSSAVETSRLSPSKIIKLSTEATRPCATKRSESQKLIESQLHEAVSKLRNRTRDIRERIAVESSTVLKLKGKQHRSKSPTVSKAGSRQPSPPKVTTELPTSSRVREGFNVTKQSLRAIQPILREWVLMKEIERRSFPKDARVTSSSSSSDSSSNNSSSSSRSSNSCTRRSRSTKPSATTCLDRKNAGTAEPSQLSVHVEPSSRLTSLRAHPARAAAAAAARSSPVSLVSTISLQNVTLRKSKPALKRLQQGRQPPSSLTKDEKPQQKKMGGAAKTRSNSRSSSSPKEPTGKRTADVREGPSLRSGYARLGRLTRSQNRNRK